MRRPVIATLILLSLAAGVPAQPSSPPPKSSPKQSPKPPTPEQALNSAKSRYAQAQQRVKDTWNLVKQARQRLTQAQREHADVLDQLRKESADDPLVRDAAAALAEARDALEAARVKALEPLEQTFAHKKLRRALAQLTVQLDDLTKARALAQERRLPVEKQTENDIRDISLDVLRLTGEVSAAEDEKLDESAEYQKASEAMDAALDAAADALKESKALKAANPRRQAAFKAVQDSYKASSAAGKAHAEARKQRIAAADAVLAAQNVVDDRKKQ